MSIEEREEFQCDMKIIDWDKAFNEFTVGIAIWTLNEDKVAPVHKMP